MEMYQQFNMNLDGEEQFLDEKAQDSKCLSGIIT